MIVGWNWIRFGFAAFGVLILYARWGKEALRIYVPRDLLKTWHLSSDASTRWEFGIFLMLGSVVAVFFADPKNPQQAITAGLGWTGFFAVPDKYRRASHHTEKKDEA